MRNVNFFLVYAEGIKSPLFINYEECKLLFKLTTILKKISYSLTMRNVNSELRD